MTVRHWLRAAAALALLAGVASAAAAQGKLNLSPDESNRFAEIRNGAKPRVREDNKDEAKKNEEAMKVFQLNAKRFPNVWPVHMGLARGHAALGHKKEALAEARLALQQAPDENNRKGIEALIQSLEGTGQGS